MVPCASQRIPSSFAASSSKISMNVRPMRLRFSSGSETPASAARNRSSASTRRTLTPRCPAKRGHDLIALVEPEQAVVDEDARQPIADGAMEQRRDHRGIDAAREREEDVAAADLAPHPLDAVVDDRGRGPARRATADVVHEPAHNTRALAGMGDFGMELHPVEAAVLVGDPRDRRAAGRCDELESRRQRTHAIAVAHPHVEQAVPLGVHLILDASEQS